MKNIESMFKFSNTDKILMYMLDSSREYIYFKDLNSRYTFINEALSEVFGLTESREVVGKTDYDFYMNDFAKKTSDDEKRLFASKLSTENMQECFQLKNGKELWCVTSKYLLYDNDNSVVGLWGISANINTQKMNEFKLEQAKTKFEKLALVDDLTGIFNRRKLQEILSYEISRAKRLMQPLTIFLFDVDQFKLINDKYGHSTGDTVLRELCKLVKSRIRESDILCRYGGDEFVVILPNTSLNDSYKLAEDIRKNIETHDYLSFRNVTVSIGVSMYEKDDDYNSLIQKADENMYKSKQNGRNCIFFE